MAGGGGSGGKLFVQQPHSHPTSPTYCLAQKGHMVHLLAVAGGWVLACLGSGGRRRRKDRGGGQEQAQRGALHGDTGDARVVMGKCCDDGVGVGAVRR